jgi:peroxiredoxin
MRFLTALTGVVCLIASAVAAPPVPRLTKELTITDPSGNHLNLDSYKGKVVLVQFLYTNCIHCQATARLNSKLQNDLGSKGLQVLGAAFNEEALTEPGLIRSFISNNGVTFPVGAVSRETVLGYLGISVMTRFVVPQIVIIDRHGTIRAQSEPLGSPELQDEDHLREVLGELLKQH